MVLLDNKNDNNNDIDNNNNDNNDNPNLLIADFLVKKVEYLKQKSPHQSYNQFNNSGGSVSQLNGLFCNIPKYKEALENKLLQDQSKLSVDHIFLQLNELFKNGENSILIVGTVIWKDEINESLGIELLKLIDIQQIDEDNGEIISIPTHLESISQYQIQCKIDVSEFPKSMIRNINYFDKGDIIRGIIISINSDSKNIQLSFDISRIPNLVGINSNSGSSGNNNIVNLYKHLGKFNTFSESIGKTTKLGVLTTTGFTNIINTLEKNQLFTNPWSCDSIYSCLNLLQLDSMIPYDESTPNNLKDSIRSHQNFIWAQDTVTNGIKYAKSGEHDKAIKYYKDALNVDHNHVNAFVALGAVYANMQQYEKAIHNFKEALRIDPNDVNADKYFKATLVKMKDSGYSADECLKYIGQTSKSIGTTCGSSGSKSDKNSSSGYNNNNNKPTKTSTTTNDKLKQLLQQEEFVFSDDSDDHKKHKKKKSKKRKERRLDDNDDKKDKYELSSNKRSRSRSRSSSRRSKRKSKSRDSGSDHSKERRKSRDRSRERSKEKSRKRSRDRESKDKSRDRSKERSRSRDRERSKDTSKDKSRKRSKERSRSRSRKRSRDRERHRDRSRDRSKERNSRNKSKERSRDKDRDKSRER